MKKHASLVSLMMIIAILVGCVGENGSVWAVSQSVGICDSYCAQWVCPSNPL